MTGVDVLVGARRWPVGRPLPTGTWRRALGAARARAQRAEERLAVVEAELAAERRRREELQAQCEALKGAVRTQAKQLFAAKSEQSAPMTAPAATDTAGQKKRGQRPGRAGHGRRQYAGAPVVEVRHEPPAEELICARCGRPRARYGEETSVQVGWRVSVVRVVHRRPRYVRTCECADTPKYVAAPPPAKLWPRALLTPTLLARILVDKYWGQQPLHRIVAAIAMEGADLAEGSLIGMFRRVQPLVDPLCAAIRERNRQSPSLHVDETRWRRLWALRGPKGWLWVFAGPDTTVFVLADSRGHQVVVDYLGLGGDSAGRAVITLICDFMAAYDALGDQVQRARCWAHYRRWILDALVRHPQDGALRRWADEWVGLVDDLFRLWGERHRAEPGSRAWEKADLALHGCAEEMAEVRGRQLQRRTLPPDARRILLLGEQHWDELTRCVQDPAIAPDNNTAERALRNAACGRKVYLGSWADWAGQFLTTMFTVLTTAHRNQLNPLTYLASYLTACAAAGGHAPQDLRRFCPWAMTAAEREGFQRPPEVEPG